jgi:hypothetical protein
MSCEVSQIFNARLAQKRRQKLIVEVRRVKHTRPNTEESCDFCLISHGWYTSVFGCVSIWTAHTESTIPLKGISKDGKEQRLCGIHRKQHAEGNAVKD